MELGQKIAADKKSSLGLFKDAGLAPLFFTVLWC